MEKTKMRGKGSRMRPADLEPKAELLQWLRGDYSAIAADAFGGECDVEESAEVACVLFDRLEGWGYDSVSREAFELALAMPPDERTELVRKHVL